MIKNNSSEILKLISYFNHFDYPLKFSEIRSLLGYQNLTKSLKKIQKSKQISYKSGFYFITGKNWIVKKREKGEKNFDKIKNKVRLSVFILSCIPFVRGIILIGSVSKGVYFKKDDFDFFVITSKNRIWISRCILSLFTKFISLNPRVIRNYKHFCCNYWLTEDNLKIKEKNKFTAFELSCSIPVFNKKIYEKLIKKNIWIKKYFAGTPYNNKIREVENPFLFIKSIIEIFINYLLIIINLFKYKNYFEDFLSTKYYKHWLNEGRISNFEKWNKYAGNNYIKGTSSKTSEFLLSRLNNVSKEYNFIPRTKIILKKINRTDIIDKFNFYDILLLNYPFNIQQKSEDDTLIKYLQLINQTYKTLRIKKISQLKEYLKKYSYLIICLFSNNLKKTYVKKIIELAGEFGSIVIVIDEKSDTDFLYQCGSDFILSKYEIRPLTEIFNILLSEKNSEINNSSENKFIDSYHNFF